MKRRAKKNNFPVDYKIVYEYNNVERKKYVNTFSSQEAIDQVKFILSKDDININECNITSVLVWDKYIGNGDRAWKLVEDYKL